MINPIPHRLTNYTLSQNQFLYDFLLILVILNIAKKNGFNQNKLFKTQVWLSETMFILIEIIEILVDVKTLN